MIHGLRQFVRGLSRPHQRRFLESVARGLAEDLLSEVMECGGEGGKPGPCPTGKKDVAKSTTGKPGAAASGPMSKDERTELFTSMSQKQRDETRFHLTSHRTDGLKSSMERLPGGQMALVGRDAKGNAKSTLLWTGKKFQSYAPKAKAKAKKGVA